MGYDIIRSPMPTMPEGLINICWDECVNNNCPDSFCPAPTTGCSDCVCDFDIGCDPFGPDSVSSTRPR